MAGGDPAAGPLVYADGECFCKCQGAGWRENSAGLRCFVAAIDERHQPFAAPPAAAALRSAPQPRARADMAPSAAARLASTVRQIDIFFVLRQAGLLFTALQGLAFL